MLGSEQNPMLARQEQTGSTLPAVTMPMAPSRFDSESEDEKFNPINILFRAMQYRKLIAILMVLGVAAGILLTALQVPRYRAVTKLEVLPQAAKVVEDLQVIKESNDTRTMMTARERLLSRAVAQRVVFDLGLADNNEFLASQSSWRIGNLVNRAFRLSDTGATKRMSFEQREALAIGLVLRELTVRPIPQTNILEISVTTPIGALSSKIADQFARSYIDQRVDQAGQTANTTRTFIEEQVGVVKQRLQSSEEDLVKYARDHELTITGENGNLGLSNISTLNASLAAVEKERHDYDTLVKFVDQGRGGDLPQVVDSEAIRNARGKLSDLKAEYQEKLTTLKPAYPEMRQLQTKISELEKQTLRTIGVITESIRLKRSELVSRETDMQKRLRDLEKEQADYQDKNIQYTILKREVDSNRSQYQSLIQKLNDIGVGSEIKSPSAAIVDTAAQAGLASPIMWLNMVMTTVLAALVAAIAVYVLELLSNKFSTPDQIEKELRLAVLGVAPKLDSTDLREALEDHSSSVSEAYRSLRTSLQFTGREGMPRTLLVTSSEPSEGKSTTTYKLALDMGLLGLKVLVIDADLRRPNMHRLFGTDHAIGLSNLLTNSNPSASMHDFFRPTKYPNVNFLTSGILPPNAPDLLSSPHMAMLLKSCSERYDVIILDSPPVIGLADAPVISRLVETTLLVVSADQVTRKSARNAVRRIKTAGGVMAGAVLTKFAVDRFDYNNAYRYMSYGYYNYGEPQKGLEGPRNESGKGEKTLVRPMARLAGRVRRVANRITDRYKSVS